MTGWKKMPNAKPIINITIDEDLLQKVEDFRFENKLANRSQTISYLVEEGFKTIEQKEEISPKFISFGEAMMALKEGKEVNFIGDNDYTYRILPKQNFNALKNDGIVWEDILNGRWLIKK